MSVRTPSKTSSNRPILNILILLERYAIRDLSFVLFVCPSVRPYVWIDRKNLRSVPKAVLTVRFSNFFFVGRYDIRNLSFVLFVCPSVRKDGQTKSSVDSKSSSNSPILKIIILFEGNDIRDLFFMPLHVCWSIP